MLTIVGTLCVLKVLMAEMVERDTKFLDYFSAWFFKYSVPFLAG